MKAFKNIWNKTLLYKFIDLSESIYFYYKDKSYVGETFYSDAFKLVIKQYLNADLKKDWLGRLYCVVNPNIDANGHFNISNIIMEIDGDNTNNNEQIRHWVYKQMSLIGQLFKIEKLYDYIDIDFEHVGPIELDNYLIIFDIASRQSISLSFKKFIPHFLIYCGLASIIFSLMLLL